MADRTHTANKINPERDEINEISLYLHPKGIIFHLA